MVRDFGGHGVGLKFHEDPFVYHYGDAGEGMVLVPWYDIYNRAYDK